MAPTPSISAVAPAPSGIGRHDGAGCLLPAGVPAGQDVKLRCQNAVSRGSPMMPVEAARTSSVTASRAATPSQQLDSRHAICAGKGAALPAQPARRAGSFAASRSRHQITGAAAVSDRVNTPATVEPAATASTTCRHGAIFHFRCRGEECAADTRELGKPLARAARPSAGLLRLIGLGNDVVIATNPMAAPARSDPMTRAKLCRDIGSIDHFLVRPVPARHPCLSPESHASRTGSAPGQRNNCRPALRRRQLECRHHLTTSGAEPPLPTGTGRCVPVQRSSAIIELFDDRACVFVSTRICDAVTARGRAGRQQKCRRRPDGLR